jgi:hypothetical protein
MDNMNTQVFLNSPGARIFWREDIKIMVFQNYESYRPIKRVEMNVEQLVNLAQAIEMFDRGTDLTHIYSIPLGEKLWFNLCRQRMEIYNCQDFDVYFTWDDFFFYKCYVQPRIMDFFRIITVIPGNARGRGRGRGGIGRGAKANRKRGEPGEGSIDENRELPLSDAMQWANRPAKIARQSAGEQALSGPTENADMSDDGGEEASAVFSKRDDTTAREELQARGHSSGGVPTGYFSSFENSPSNKDSEYYSSQSDKYCD